MVRRHVYVYAKTSADARVVSECDDCGEQFEAAHVPLVKSYITASDYRTRPSVLCPSCGAKPVVRCPMRIGAPS